MHSILNRLLVFYNGLTPVEILCLWALVKIAIVVGVVQGLVAYSVLAERKISAWIQDRCGPNRCAPPFVKYLPGGVFLTRLGIFQPLADGLKFMFKEDFTPAGVKKIYFFLAPAVAVIPAMLTVAVIPFGSQIGSQKMVIADLNVGILYTFGIVSMGVYGIVLAGYAANSKYPFFGGIRSSAQMISYEISMGMSVIPVLLIVGSLNLGAIISWQATHGWLAIYSPISFIIFMVASFAETNRTPFDLPEAETELVGGYHTEYSSMKFALFFLAEYSNMVSSSAMMVTLFFGGWTLPFWGLDQPATSVWMGLASILVFLVKMLFFMVVFIW
ncbi:MAG TPA: complex I subunit 1 family protein, partial [Candidatus Sulfotelmatobacter sp.]|nr:complex I subunit 1 family protein [Candidatus Sulfotelmatobacter sp.]